MRLAHLLSFAFTVVAVSAQPTNEKIRYAVIGDSYSCGEGAKASESWPALLTQHLKSQGIDVDLVSNPSVTGWTTKDAIDKELPKFIRSNPTFASILIGVNDWVQGVDETTFRNRFSYLVDQMLAVLPNKKKLLVVTIPDFGVTPTGPKYSRGRNIHEEHTSELQSRLHLVCRLLLEKK